MFKGLRSVIYPVTDIAQAKEWYSTLLDMEPYFDQPFYVGFSVGPFELGLDPDPNGGTPGTSGPTTYWAVDDIDAALSHLLEHGAGAHSDIQDVGEGIRLAVVTDPFGNKVGIITASAPTPGTE